jgi:hypothetical protein
MGLIGRDAFEHSDTRTWDELPAAARADEEVAHAAHR